ncbi:MAG: ATP-binding cassette domain-containing protein [Anaerolineales bacterium]
MIPLLEVRDLVVIRGDQEALQLDHLVIHQGEVLAVVGPNGAGKSTLLWVLARLLKPERGEITLNGRSVAAESDTAYRRRIALVMEEPMLFEGSVFDNVAAGLTFRRCPEEETHDRVARWLEKLGVAGLVDRDASELSGGEARRVGLARALVLEPELLLLDEPFSALDPPARAAILEDLALLLPGSGMTTVFVTHDLREAAQLGTRLAVVIGNRLRQVDGTKQLLTAPVDDDVRRFLRGGSAAGGFPSANGMR